MDTIRWTRHAWSLGVSIVAVALATAVLLQGNVQGQARGGGQGAGRGGPYSLSDPIPQEPALRGAIDLHAHQDPDSNGPSYGQAARSIDAIDLAKRAKAAGMRGFVIKQHLDQTAGYAYYMRKLVPDMEIFGGMGSNLTNGLKVNPWAITHMTEIRGGWGRIVWMPSWDSEHSSHESRRKPPAFISVARCADGKPFWANFPKPCPNAELLPEVKEAISVIATAKTRDSNGDLILATGHSGPDEVMMMIREAVKAGVKHVIITHPLLGSVGMSDAQIKEAVGLGPEIYAEFTSQFGRPNAAPEMVKRYVGAIRAAGVEHAFVSSDTGQLTSPFQPDALADAAKALRGQGFTERELDLLFKNNPAKILGLTPPSSVSQ
jgi:hypothetical protein